VFDLQGRFIQQGSIQNGMNELQARDWESGVYQLVITAKSGSSKVITVVKE
jgi:hypothetical protein